MDDDGFASVRDLDLLGGGDEEVLQVALHVGLDLKVENCLRNLLLEGVRLRVALFDNFLSRCEHSEEANSQSTNHEKSD